MHKPPRDEGWPNSLVNKGIMLTTTSYLPHKWSEEQTRYQFLQLTYERAGRLGQQVVSTQDIGWALGVGFGEALRIVGWLEFHGYLHCFGSGRCISISRAGTKYLEELARRRRSIRA